MIKLFLLKPDFKDDSMGEKGQLYFCPPCAMVNGYLAYYPKVKEKIEVIYTEFERPRKAIVDLIGHENQSCPVLVVDKEESLFAPHYLQSNGNFYFIDIPELIMSWLSERFNSGLPH